MDEQQQKKKSKKHIGAAAIAVLVVLAIIADLIGLIPFVEDFAIVVYWFIVAVYLWYKGYGFVNSRRIAVMVIDVVIGMIPGVQALPQITAGIIAVIVMIRIEEKTGISITGAVSKGKMPGPLNSGGSRMPTTPQLPLNDGGRRLPSGGLASNRTQMTDIKVPTNPTRSTLVD